MSVCFVFVQITDNRKNVFAVELLEEEQVTEVTQVIFDHLRSVISERDGYVEVRSTLAGGGRNHSHFGHLCERRLKLVRCWEILSILQLSTVFHREFLSILNIQPSFAENFSASYNIQPSFAENFSAS